MQTSARPTRYASAIAGSEPLRVSDRKCPRSIWLAMSARTPRLTAARTQGIAAAGIRGRRRRRALPEAPLTPLRADTRSACRGAPSISVDRSARGAAPDLVQQDAAERAPPLPGQAVDEVVLQPDAAVRVVAGPVAAPPRQDAPEVARVPGLGGEPHRELGIRSCRGSRDGGSGAQAAPRGCGASVAGRRARGRRWPLRYRGGRARRGARGGGGRRCGAAPRPLRRSGLRRRRGRRRRARRRARTPAARSSAHRPRKVACRGVAGGLPLRYPRAAAGRRAGSGRGGRNPPPAGRRARGGGAACATGSRRARSPPSPRSRPRSSARGRGPARLPAATLPLQTSSRFGAAAPSGTSPGIRKTTALSPYFLSSGKPQVQTLARPSSMVSITVLAAGRLAGESSRMRPSQSTVR